MSQLLLTNALLLNVLAYSGTDPHAAEGHFKWAPSPDSVAFYRRHHAPVPSGQIVLTPSGIFRFTMSDELGSEITLGTFTVQADRVVFKVETGPAAGLPLVMKLDAKGLSATGSTFVREKLVSELAIHVDVPAPPPVLHTEIEGVWTLRSSGEEIAMTRFAFSGSGTFRYQGAGGSSAGDYKITEDGIELTYNEIDGEPVEPGCHFHKTLPFLEGRSAFQVDTYRYERASG